MKDWLGALAKSGGYIHCGSEEMFLICYMILQHQMIKRPRDFTGTKPAKYVITLLSLVTIGIEVVKIQ